MNITFYATVKDKKISFDSPELVKNFVEGIKDGKRVQVTIQNESKDPTQKQWAYLYSCVYKMFLGKHFDTLDEIDQFFKGEFKKAFGIALPNGITLEKKSFNREWLSKYIDFAVWLSTQYGYTVPIMEVKNETIPSTNTDDIQ